MMASATAMELCKSVKFRQACDKCQNNKVRCSRDNPICKRCARRQFTCIYSPLRRIGRPRNFQRMEKHDDATSRVYEMSVDEGDGSPASVAATALYGHASQLRGDVLLPTNRCEAAPTFPLSLVGKDLLFHSVENAWIPDRHASPMSSNIAHIKADIRGDSVSAPAISVSTAVHALSDWYTEVLARTTKLEQALAQTTSSPTIDFVLEAERDFNHLHCWLFACAGHQACLSLENPPLPTESEPQSTIITRSCPATDRPVFLSLALFAERVVTLLEEMFRQVTKSTQSMDQATDFIWSKTSETSDPSARRVQRSLYSATKKPCVSVGMDSYCELYLGDCAVEAQAKADALGQILKLRVKRMLRALEALHAAKQTNPWAGQRRGQTSGDPFDWGGSTSVLHAVAGTLLDDLIRRMESLQAAMVFL
ncbi:hypothetical protein F5B22DRAFT_228409 [Xylaria bambusicola]|uniref:uncharacterized protein n=1 Tax=Xylaria bambusicola TaxID=326684 RepID=UPI0020089123|nr:uncharacterized protein F5B22DRAFT_228409 [Xylaria bambusicola]KAI0514721.1 hypothetical protein F5B22DRAFT_228409 [Xylaria bambusicola]